jgi:hypothetical protein
MTMIKLADNIGRVMMGFNLSKERGDAGINAWAEIEYGKDKNYAMQELQSGRIPDVR